MNRKAVGFVALVALFGAITAFSAEPGGPLVLEDGSYVFVGEDGTTRMVDRSGRPMKMPDDVEMKTVDGSIIVMRNSRIWKLVGPPTKGKRMSTDG